MNSIIITCNDPECFFVGNYHQTTLEKVIEHRKVIAEIPLIPGECAHSSVSYQVVEKEN